jgi:hypothetical protein
VDEHADTREDGPHSRPAKRRRGRVIGGAVFVAAAIWAAGSAFGVWPWAFTQGVKQVQTRRKQAEQMKIQRAVDATATAYVDALQAAARATTEERRNRALNEAEVRLSQKGINQAQRLLDNVDAGTGQADTLQDLWTADPLDWHSELALSPAEIHKNSARINLAKPLTVRRGFSGCQYIVGGSFHLSKEYDPKPTWKIDAAPVGPGGGTAQWCFPRFVDQLKASWAALTPAMRGVGLSVEAPPWAVGHVQRVEPIAAHGRADSSRGKWFASRTLDRESARWQESTAWRTAPGGSPSLRFELPTRVRLLRIRFHNGQRHDSSLPDGPYGWDAFHRIGRIRQATLIVNDPDAGSVRRYLVQFLDSPNLFTFDCDMGDARSVELSVTQTYPADAAQVALSSIEFWATAPQRARAVETRAPPTTAPAPIFHPTSQEPHNRPETDLSLSVHAACQS